MDAIRTATLGLLLLLAACSTPRDRNDDRPSAAACAAGIAASLALEGALHEWGDMHETQPGVYRQR